jgi:hypothetical protein
MAEVEIAASSQQPTSSQPTPAAAPGEDWQPAASGARPRRLGAPASRPASSQQPAAASRMPQPQRTSTRRLALTPEPRPGLQRFSRLSFVVRGGWPVAREMARHRLVRLPLIVGAPRGTRLSQALAPVAYATSGMSVRNRLVHRVCIPRRRRRLPTTPARMRLPSP